MLPCWITTRKKIDCCAEGQLESGGDNDSGFAEILLLKPYWWESFGFVLLWSSSGLLFRMEWNYGIRCVDNCVTFESRSQHDSTSSTRVQGGSSKVEPVEESSVRRTILFWSVYNEPKPFPCSKTYKCLAPFTRSTLHYCIATTHLSTFSVRYLSHTQTDWYTIVNIYYSSSILCESLQK